ncbi:lysine transporter LysE [Kiloniella spongiae]|uniref:Lysine transporter LysE n=1 Tax=Kiloniella spongiae TaxID=1489064 RepID=A0A0H2ME29_9PROT|nr:LysE family translocator [Kiloniella spongiae]KLN60814.1 lysine transporter LysE [Kiloniella spongiae]
MIDLISLASIGLAFFIVAVSPGPATLANATVSMSKGRKAGLIYGAGLSCGLGFWGIVAASGLGAVLQSSMYLLMILKVFGGLYLLWLAFQSVRAAMKSDTKQQTQPSTQQSPATQSGTKKWSMQNWFIQGLILNLSNPKAVVAWMAALSVGLDANANEGVCVYALIAATLMCMAIGVLVYVFYAVIFSFGGIMRGYKRGRRWINGAIAGLFTLAGFGLIRSAFVR